MKASVIKLAKRTLHRIGLEVIPSGASRHLLLVETLKEVFREYQIDTVLDVGGNHGQFGDYLRNSIKFNGRIVSFEPSPEDFRILSDHASLDFNWKTVNTALGEKEGRLPFNVAGLSVFSSFLNPSHEHVSYDGNGIAETIDVDVVRLDSLVPSLQIDLRKTYLKVDTQGFDLSVLRGARHALQDLPAFQTELSFLPIYKDMPDATQVLEELRGFGFDVAAFAPVNYDRGRLVEVDCVMLNRALLP